MTETEKQETPVFSIDSRSKGPQVKDGRSEDVFDSDVRAIAKLSTAKNLATNQGVRGYVDQEIRRSEMATAQAMGEAFQALTETMAKMQGELEHTITTFQVAHDKRLCRLETRWWERLMRDLEADWDTFIEWMFNGRDVEDSFDLVSPISSAPSFTPQLEDALSNPCVECGHAAGDHSFQNPGACIADNCTCKGYVSANEVDGPTPEQDLAPIGG